MTRFAALLLAAAALTGPLALSAQTLDLPQRRAGLWEITMTMDRPKGMPAMTTRMCVDAATDREMMDYALKVSGSCKSLTTRREGKTLVIASDCAFAGKQTKSRTVLTGDFQSSYTSRTEGTMDDGDGRKPRPTVVTQTASWKGADCPGMRPGDVTMFGGLKLNIKQIKAMSGLIR
jgi:hypothetical protein